MVLTKAANKTRCAWAVAGNALMLQYHDEEWGVPLFDDRALFEVLILEGAQAGLSWQTVLNKRAAYRQALDGFDAKKIAGYNAAKLQKLLADPGLIRNRLKMQAIVANAKAFLEVRREFGSFCGYIWGFVGGVPVQNSLEPTSPVPATSEASVAMSHDLYKRGFRFVGSTICYAFMQAVGMVNDHTTECFRYKEVARLATR